MHLPRLKLGPPVEYRDRPRGVSQPPDPHSDKSPGGAEWDDKGERENHCESVFLDGNIDLAETDVCDDCHSDGGAFDGVNDPVIGAKANWADGVYAAGTLRPDRLDWCAGCHDAAPAVVNGIEAPSLMGDNVTWGYNVSGHGQSSITCTECHDPTLPHTDGVARTFSERAAAAECTARQLRRERALVSSA